MLNRKRIKKVLSIAGATLILGTFIAKDARKDKLKELVDSLDAAENAYMIRADNQRNYEKLKQIEDEISGLGMKLNNHPTTAELEASTYRLVGPFWKPMSDIDWLSLNILRDSKSANDELIENVIRLSDKLPRFSEDQQYLVYVQKSNRDLNQEIASLDDRVKDSKHLPHGEKLSMEAIESVNKSIYNLIAHFEAVAEMTDFFSDNVLRDAEEERIKDDRKYGYWTSIYYVLYAVGWIISMAGILIGGEEEKSVLEELSEV